MIIKKKNFIRLLNEAEEFIRELEQVSILDIGEKFHSIELLKNELIAKYDELLALEVNMSEYSDRYELALSNLTCYINICNNNTI